jgi:hypothetical protein
MCRGLSLAKFRTVDPETYLVKARVLFGPGLVPNRKGPAQQAVARGGSGHFALPPSAVLH